MKPIHIDFAPYSFRRALKRTPHLWWIVAAIGLALCASAATVALDLSRQSKRLQSDLLQIQAQLVQSKARKLAPGKIVIPDPQAGAVNRSIAQLNLPWRDAFEAVENATPATVALLSMEPDAKKFLFRGVAESQTSDGMIAYIEALKKQVFFESVILVRHEINEKDPNQPIRYQFEAKWAEIRQ